MAWAKLGTKTFTSAGTSITTDTFTASNFMQIINHTFADSGVPENGLRFNSDSTTKYAVRYSSNGGADGTFGNEPYLELNLAAFSTTSFQIVYICSISGQEKLAIAFHIRQNTAGAGTAPDREEIVGKYVPSPDANITTVTLYNVNSGNFAIDSNISVLGSDATISNSIQNGLEFHETDTNKDYVFNSSNSTWYQIA